MKINFEMLAYSSETLGWTKTVALVRNGFETGVITETECNLALEKLQAMFKHYNWFELEHGENWHTAFNAVAFDLSKPFSLERDLDNLDLPVAGYNKQMQKIESIGEPVSVQYPVLGDFESDCIMHRAEAV